MPQNRRVVVEPRHVAPPQPTPSNLLRLTGHVETQAERAERVVRVIRRRCASVLSEDDLSQEPHAEAPKLKGSKPRTAPAASTRAQRPPAPVPPPVATPPHDTRH